MRGIVGSIVIWSYEARNKALHSTIVAIISLVLPAIPSHFRVQACKFDYMF